VKIKIVIQVSGHAFNTDVHFEFSKLVAFSNIAAIIFEVQL